MSINIKSKAKEYYGFVHSPAFQKQQPESAVTQNTTQREWCCIALPKRIDALVLPSFESNAKRANVLSAWTPLYRCDYMLSFRSIWLLALTMSQYKLHIVYHGPSLSGFCAAVF
ncbi:hypothetical protein N7501_011573 [Penicillium viridicatum]|nr:hypothetical protein N7501_011573 [Penicillium viridicatum]